MAGPLKTYAFINAKLRTRISRILPPRFILQLIRARSLAESVQMLESTDYAPAHRVYEQTGDIKTVELELLKIELAIYLELERLVEDKVRAFISALGERFEVENLKNALRLWFDRRIRGRSIEEARGFLLRRHIHHTIDLDGIISAESLEEAADRLAATPYAAILSRQAPAVKKAESLFPLDLELDRYQYGMLIAAAEQLPGRDREIARRLLGVEIDLQNVAWLIRFKSFYSLQPDRALASVLPGGLNLGPEQMRESYGAEKTDSHLSAVVARRYPEIAPLLGSREQTRLSGRLVMMERILEQILSIEVRKILSGYPFTVGIIMAYFVLKSNEIRKIMTVLNAKFYGWPEERIRTLV